MRGNERGRLRLGRVILGVFVVLLALATAAFAAHPSRTEHSAVAHHLSLKPGRGTSPPARGAQGALLFRVSRDGRSMQLVGHTAFTVRCYRNGRRTNSFQVQVAQGNQKGATIVPAPLATIKASGAFYGAGSHSFKVKAGPSQTLRYHLAGRLTGTGRTAVGKFFAGNCSSSQFHAVLALASSKVAAASSSGLVAAYAFDEGTGTTVTDASGNGNNGTVANGTWSTTGKYGDALKFNGTSTRVTIPNAASLQLSTGMTLEAWVDPSTVNGSWRDVVYKGNDNYYLEATSTNASLPDAGVIAGGSYADAFGTAKLTANAWSFLTETYDGSTVRLYVNGTQVASTAHTGAISTSTNPLQIGGDSIYGQYFAGLIDNVRVYNVGAHRGPDPDRPGAPRSATSGGGDTTPPSAPGTLTANAASGGEVDLSWGAATDNVGVTGYDVERCTGTTCTTFAQIAATSGTGTTYKDTTVSASTGYSYRVRAFDAAGNQGAYSNTATATTPGDTTPPSAPGTLTANAASGGEVDLSWGAATDNVGVTGYDVERCAGAGCTNFTQIATTGTGTTYKDTTVAR